jgi:16S rRNA (guanine527-N7)-methyltransferase
VTDKLTQVLGRPVSRETYERLEAYVKLLVVENERQNLVSRGTLEGLWNRHIIDSAQLIGFEPRPGSAWVDIGSGAGLPGVIVACLIEGPVMLVEPRFPNWASPLRFGRRRPNESRAVST